MAVQSSATTVWEGDLAHGAGNTTPESGAFETVSWASRTARVELDPDEGVRSCHIAVRGKVPGIDQDAFAEAAGGASEGGPISGALKRNIDIAVEATLQSG